MYGYEEEHLDWHCPNTDCDFHGEPIVDITNENTDRDGNRGRKMMNCECPKCGEEESRWL